MATKVTFKESSIDPQGGCDELGDSNLGDDYPNSYGFSDENGTKFIVNTQQKSVFLFHRGVTIAIDKKGRLFICSKDDMEISSHKKIKMTCEEDFTIETKGNFKVTALKGISTITTGVTSVTSTANVESPKWVP